MASTVTPRLPALASRLPRTPAFLTRLALAPLRASTLLLAVLALFASSAPARGADESGRTTKDLERWLRQSVQLPDGQTLRVEVEVGTLHQGLKLAPCDKAEPFLPGSTRLWGRANIGLRCVAGARWTAYIPVRIAAYGPALVARVPLPAGRIPRAEDFSMQEVDWAASRSTPVANRAVVTGRELVRPLAAGQPLLTEYLRIAPAVRAGNPVAVTLAGSGFTIVTEAVALSSAADGQRVRVRTAAGKVLNGMVEGNSVRILR